MRLLKKLALFSIMTLLSSPVLAVSPPSFLAASPPPLITPIRKGFSTLLLGQPAVAKIWPSVFSFLLPTPRIQMGSATLVEIIEKPDRREAIFITNRHVIEAVCAPPVAVGSSCPGAVLTQNIYIRMKEDVYETLQLSGVSSRRLSVVRMGKNLDLALVRASFPKRTKLPPTLKISPDCRLIESNKLWSVGFSWLPYRAKTEVETNLDADVVTKRWSEGDLVTIPVGDQAMASESDSIEAFFTSTIDAIGGGSGGPVFDERGVVLGLQTLVSGLSDDHWSYVGADTRESPPYHSIAISCEALRSFMAKKASLNGIRIQYF